MKFSDLLDFSKRKARHHSDFIKYISIGFIGMALDSITFVILYRFYGVSYIVANFIGMSVGICNNFFMNAFFNFKKTDKLLLRFFSFYGVGLSGIALSELILYLFHDRLGITAEIVKIGTLPFIAVFQFALNKTISFRARNISN